MASLTLKNIPQDLMRRLRRLAGEERRSLNQQAIFLLERALDREYPSLLEAHEEYVREHGRPPFDDEFFEGLRSRETGRSVELDGGGPAT